MNIDEYRANIAELDNEHHLLLVTLSLIKVTLSLDNIDGNKILPHLKNFVERSKSHFRSEEQHLLTSSCPKDVLKEHISVHRELEDKLDQIVLNPENRNLYSQLENWLIPHLLADKEILATSSN